MHRNLQISDSEVEELRKLGIKCTNAAKHVVTEAVKAVRNNKMYPELSHRAGLCQKALANQDAFKRMVLIQEAKERKAKAEPVLGSDARVAVG